MSQGEREKQCLDKIKETLFYNYSYDEKSIENLLQGELFEKENIRLKHNARSHYYGMSDDDINNFEKSIYSAMLNHERSQFPDFILYNGFMEHFQVTSSEESKKGSSHKKDEFIFKTKVEKEEKAIKDEIIDKHPSLEVQTYNWEQEYLNHSYDNFKKSLRRNWENHINSLNQYNGNKEIGVFIIEMTEFTLSMHENIYNGLKNGLTYGDLRNPQSFICYRLSRDKDMLQYLYSFKDSIDFIIFVNCEGFEVIKLENIPEIIKLLPWDFVIAPLKVKERHSLLTLSVKKEDSGK